MKFTVETPNPIKTEGQNVLKLNPGQVGSLFFKATLPADTVLPPNETELISEVMVSFPGPTDWPKYFQSGYPKVMLNGEDFNFRTGTFMMELGEEVELELIIGLNSKAPWQTVIPGEIDARPYWRPS